MNTGIFPNLSAYFLLECSDIWRLKSAYPLKYPLQDFFGFGVCLLMGYNLEPQRSDQKSGPVPFRHGTAFPVLAALLDFVDVLLHPVGAIPLHLVRDVAVDIQGKGRGSVAKVPLDGLHVVTGLERGHREGMPLRYIYDNTGKSSNCNGSTAFLPSFQR